jgi:hypothetical protein
LLFSNTSASRTAANVVIAFMLTNYCNLLSKEGVQRKKEYKERGIQTKNYHKQNNKKKKEKRTFKSQAIRTVWHKILGTKMWAGKYHGISHRDAPLR